MCEKKDCELILYGAGKRCSQLIAALRCNDVRVKAIIDSDISKQKKYIDGIIILSPSYISLFVEN